jgi:hypothetical protein
MTLPGVRDVLGRLHRVQQAERLRDDAKRALSSEFWLPAWNELPFRDGNAAAHEGADPVRHRVTNS